jgi:integrase
MASVHRRPNTPYWFAAWRLPDGRLSLRSTKQTDRTKAEDVARGWERASKAAAAGNLTEIQARAVLSDILKATGGDAIRSPKTADWLRKWAETKEPSTRQRYRGILTPFLEGLGDRAQRPLSNLTPRDIQDFSNRRAASGLAPKTVSMGIKTLRAALNEARRLGLITGNPAEAVKPPTGRAVTRGTFTPAEVQMLVDAAEGDWKTLIMTGYYLGGRIGDCARLTWDSLDLAQGRVCFIAEKTGKETTAPLHADLQAHLEIRAGTDHPEKYVMPALAELKSGGRNGLSSRFEAIARRAGVDLQYVKGPGGRQQARRSFHALRHTFTSALANAGVSPELRMKLTGHASEGVHRQYTHHEMETLRDAVAKVPSLSAKTEPA